MRTRLAVFAVACALTLACGSNPSAPSASGGPPGRLTMTFTPQDQSFAAATEEYRRVWAEDGTRIVDTMQGITGLTFVQTSIAATVYEGISLAGDRDSPMRLRASYPMDTKRSALVHELGHRLIDQLTTRPNDLDEHRVLNLFLYEVWESLWGREFADRQVVVESAQRGVYDYESAWRWALALTKDERASRFLAIRRSNGK